MREKEGGRGEQKYRKSEREIKPPIALNCRNVDAHNSFGMHRPGFPPPLTVSIA